MIPTNPCSNFIDHLTITHPGSVVSHFSSSRRHWVSTRYGRGLICSNPGHRWTRCEFCIHSVSRWQSSSGRALKRTTRCWGIQPLQRRTECEEKIKPHEICLPLKNTIIIFKQSQIIERGQGNAKYLTCTIMSQITKQCRTQKCLSHTVVSVYCLHFHY